MESPPDRFPARSFPRAHQLIEQCRTIGLISDRHGLDEDAGLDEGVDRIHGAAKIFRVCAIIRSPP